MLQGKKILIGVSGSIAAYKTAFLIRLLKKQKAEVKVVCTPSASSFIGKLTLATLSENEVYDSFYNQNQTDWTNHVELGLWADLFVIVPATANTIAKMANGICDNLLLAVYLSAKCKVMVAPAMDLDMFVHPSTQNNLVKINYCTLLTSIYSIYILYNNNIYNNIINIKRLFILLTPYYYYIS